jgi:serine/threonine protein kinase
LKPDNILVGANGMLKIGDFGISRVLSHTKSNAKTKKTCTTPLFKSPEQMKDKPHTSKVDVWAAGVILYFMVSGRYPFDLLHDKGNEYALSIKVVEEQHEEIKDASADMNELINKLLTKDPDARPSIKEVLKFPIL